MSSQKEKFKEAHNTFKKTFKEEKSKLPKDIINREKKRETAYKIKALDTAIINKDNKQVDVLKSKKNSNYNALLDENKKRVEKRTKAWSDRSYRTIGPTAGATIGVAVGSIFSPIGTAIGGVIGLGIGTLAAGRIIQKVALDYGIPAHKAYKKSTEKFKNLKKEEKHKKGVEQQKKDTVIQSVDEYGRGEKKGPATKMNQLGQEIKNQTKYNTTKRPKTSPPIKLSQGNKALSNNRDNKIKTAQ